jgi:acetyl esterase/lipase
MTGFAANPIPAHPSEESVRQHQGGHCEVQVWPGQVHAFPMIGARTSLPEADAAIDYGARFIATAP